MDEAQVKAALLTRVRALAKRKRKPLVTAEFSLGSSGVRADMAVFANGTVGFEIKTARDSLRRLPSQLKAYSCYFNHVVALVAPRHVEKLKIQNLFGASLWTYNDEGLVSVVYEGRTHDVEDSYLTDILTKAEREKFDFRSAIEARYGSTSRRFWSETSRRIIRPEDLPLLSRFSEERANAKQHNAVREARWAEWLAAQKIEASALA